MAVAKKSANLVSCEAVKSGRILPEESTASILRVEERAKQARCYTFLKF